MASPFERPVFAKARTLCLKWPEVTEESAWGRLRLLAAVAVLLAIAGTLLMPVRAQHAGTFRGSLDDPAIAYATRPLDNVVADVNRRLLDGSLRFSFDRRNGYLDSALDALKLPIDSQLLVFSRGSLQGRRIDEQNPRALFFNERVAIGWVPEGDLLEVAAHDATAGVVFYTLPNRLDPQEREGSSRTAAPPLQFRRVFNCLPCHVTGDTLGVPGFLMFSTSRRTGAEFDGVPRHIDQSDPLSQRFGGWFITGSTGSAKTMANQVNGLDDRPSRELLSVDRLFNIDGYRAVTSDVVAQLVLTHQAGTANVLTRAAYEARLVTGDEAVVAPIMRGIASEVVDSLLFLDEAKLPDRVRGSSGFAERFSSSGPRDRKGRSLYELDLNTRLFKYPCSYLIYSPAFDALPAKIKEPIYRRMLDVLPSRENGRAVIEILRDTKKDLPDFFAIQ